MKNFFSNQGLEPTIQRMVGMHSYITAAVSAMPQPRKKKATDIIGYANGR